MEMGVKSWGGEKEKMVGWGGRNIINRKEKNRGKKKIKESK